MGAFDGPPLIAGSIYGFRHFNVSPGGVLRSPAYEKYRWTPGVNQAVCALGYPEGFNAWRGYVHHIAARGCSCGLYAYRYPWFSQYMGPARAMGVIEGTGRTSVGSRGFRAEQARIVAVCLPVGAGTRLYRGWRAIFLLLVFTVTVLLVPAFLGFWGLILWMVLFRVVGSSYLRPRKDLYEALHHQYPEAKIYRSRVAMILAYLPKTRAKVNVELS